MPFDTNLCINFISLLVSFVIFAFCGAMCGLLILGTMFKEIGEIVGYFGGAAIGVCVWLASLNMWFPIISVPILN